MSHEPGRQGKQGKGSGGGGEGGGEPFLVAIVHDVSACSTTGPRVGVIVHLAAQGMMLRTSSSSSLIVSLSGALRFFLVLLHSHFFFLSVSLFCALRSDK